MPSSAARVSVILPCFNCEGTLASALASALAQTLPHVELLAVDDGSTDRTGEILAEHGRRFPDLVRTFRQEHAGPYVGRNLAARHARGDYLAFLDGDDEWHPEKLERQVALMDERVDVVLCHTGILVHRPDAAAARIKIPDPAYRGRCFRTLLVANGINTSSVMIRTDLFHSLGGFDESFPARGDWEMWTRVARHGAFEIIEEPLTRLLDHPSRMSSDTARMRTHHLAVIAKNARRYHGDVPGLPHLLRQARLAAHLQYASDFLRAGRGALALRETLLALRHGPASGRAWKTAARATVSLAHALPWTGGDAGSDGSGGRPPAKPSRPHVS